MCKASTLDKFASVCVCSPNIGMHVGLHGFEIFALSRVRGLSIDIYQNLLCIVNLFENSIRSHASGILFDLFDYFNEASIHLRNLSLLILSVFGTILRVAFT